MNHFSFAAFSLSALALLPFAALAAPPADSALPPDVPVHHWAAGSVGRLEHQRILGLEPDGRFRGDKPVTRYELAVALDRFVRYIETAHQPLHAEKTHAPVTLPQTAPDPARRALEHLVTQGFLTPASPLLLKNGAQPASAQELTDALAAVTIRLSDRAEAPQKE